MDLAYGVRGELKENIYYVMCDVTQAVTVDVQALYYHTQKTTHNTIHCLEPTRHRNIRTISYFSR